MLDVEIVHIVEDGLDFVYGLVVFGRKCRYRLSYCNVGHIGGSRWVPNVVWVRQ